MNSTCNLIFTVSDVRSVTVCVSEIKYKEALKLACYILQIERFYKDEEKALKTIYIQSKKFLNTDV